MLGDAGPVQARDGGADVEGTRVIVERRPAFENDSALRGIETRGRRDDEARGGTHAERPHVNLELVLAILTRHEAWHHTRVHRHGPVHHHREPHAGRGIHGPGAEHVDARVPATHQDEVVPDRGRGIHRADRNAGPPCSWEWSRAAMAP